MEEVSGNPNISARDIAVLMRAMQIYKRRPPDSDYQSICLDVLRHRSASRQVDMAVLKGYAELIWNSGNTVRTFLIDGMEMKAQRIKAARHIFVQCEKRPDPSRQARYSRRICSTCRILKTMGGITVVCFLYRALRLSTCRLVAKLPLQTLLIVMALDLNRLVLHLRS